MRRKIFLLLALLLTVQVFFGQETLSDDKIQLGKSYRGVKSPIKEYYRYKDLLLSYKNYGREVFLQTYDSKKLTNIKTKLYLDFPGKFHKEEIIIIKDRVYFFYSVFRKRKESLFMREIDMDSCSFIGEGKLVFEVNSNVSSALGTNETKPGVIPDKFDFSVSSDESKLLIQYRIRLQKIDEYYKKDKIGFKVFDQDLNEIWGKVVEMPYITRRMENMDKVVDPKGNVYLVSFIYRDKSNRRINRFDKGINYDVELYRIEANTDSLFQTKVMLDNDRLINDIRLYEAGNNNIICAGYSSIIEKKEKNLGNVSGLFKFDLKSGFENPKIDYYEIPLEIINQNAHKKDISYNNKRVQEGKKPTIFGLELDLIHFCSDSSILLIGEQYYRTSTRYYVIPTPAFFIMGSNDYSHYYDILATKINKDGSLVWMKKLAKRQIIEFGVNRGYKFFETNSDFCFIYFDDRMNLDIGLDKEPQYQRNSVNRYLTAHKINQNTGEVKKMNLFSPYNPKGLSASIFKVEDLMSIVKDEFIIEIYKSKLSTKNFSKVGFTKEALLLKMDLK